MDWIRGVCSLCWWAVLIETRQLVNLKRCECDIYWGVRNESNGEIGERELGNPTGISAFPSRLLGND